VPRAVGCGAGELVARSFAADFGAENLGGAGFQAGQYHRRSGRPPGGPTLALTMIDLTRRTVAAPVGR
jgi:hypothetical protein